ncbi:MAG: sensor histidine kinase [Planctomycetota bacterium]
MKLSITARLTLTTALLTLLVFAVFGVALAVSLVAGIRADATTRAEDLLRQLAFNANHQWDGLLDLGGEAQLGVIRLSTRDWALVRGDGRVLTAQGVFVDAPELVQVGASQVRERGDDVYRIASTPLFAHELDSFANLPSQVQETVRRESTTGQFLRAKYEVQTGGKTVIEVRLLEGEQVVELEITYGGKLLDRVDRRLAVPPDLRALVASSGPFEQVEPAGWRAHQGQLVALFAGKRADGTSSEIAVSRLGEQFELDADRNIIANLPASRIWLATAVDATAERAAAWRTCIAVALGFLALWMLVVFVGRYVTRQAMSPVQKIVDSLEAIEITNLDARLPVLNPEDELGRISATINGMLERIKLGYAREQKFTADASHELRSPIAKVLADIDVALAKARSSEEYRATLVRCQSYALGMRRLVESLLSLARLDARRDEARVRSFDLTDMAADVIRVFPHEQAARIHLDLSATDTVVTATGVPELVRILLQNLLDNALRYSPPLSPVDLRLARHNGCVEITVDDHGCGIPAEQIDLVFSRFYRVDKARARETGGFGLGLAIVDEIARVHGGKVQLANRVDCGLRATFSLPASDAQKAAPARVDVDA